MSNFEEQDQAFEKTSNQERIDDKKIEEEGDALSEKERNVINTFLGNGDQIWKKVEAELDALERGQAGSFKVGTSGFINNIIESGGQKLSPEEYGICKRVIMEYVDIVQDDKDLRAEVHGYLDDFKNEKKEEEKSLKEKMMVGTQDLQKEEFGRTGIHPEDLNNR